MTTRAEEVPFNRPYVPPAFPAAQQREGPRTWWTWIEDLAEQHPKDFAKLVSAGLVSVLLIVWEVWKGLTVDAVPASLGVNHSGLR